MALCSFTQKHSFTWLQFHNLSLTSIPSLKLQLLYIVTPTRNATTFGAEWILLCVVSEMQESDYAL
jgi:hypothetical protein